MTTVFKIQFWGGEYLLVRAVLSMRLHAKRAVLWIIVSEKSMKFNWPDLKEVLCLCPNVEKDPPCSERCE